MNAMLKTVSQKIRKIEWYRVILLNICLFAAIYTDTKTIFTNGYVGMTTLEFLIYIMNAEINICFYLLFAILIIAGDIGWNSGKIVVNIDKKKESLWAHITLKIILRVLITVFVYLIIGVIAYSIKGVLDFSNTWTSEADVGSPLFALFFSLVFLIARLTFLGIIIATINVKSKYPIGIVAPIIISMLDYWFYYIFDITTPLYILPIEHTRVFFTEAVAPTSSMYSRVSYFTSFLYWAVLMIISITILKKVLKMKLSERRKNGE